MIKVDFACAIAAMMVAAVTETEVVKSDGSKEFVPALTMRVYEDGTVEARIDPECLKAVVTGRPKAVMVQQLRAKEGEFPGLILRAVEQPEQPLIVTPDNSQKINAAAAHALGAKILKEH